MSTNPGSGNRLVNKDTTLSSNTKFSCPFSRTKRFPDNNPICPEAFYTVEHQFSSRKTGMGYGKKVEFTSFLPRTPGADRYRIKSSFDERKGSSFGHARQKSPDRSYFIPQIHKNPGPGQYQNQIDTRMRQTYSIHSKTIDVIEKTRTSNYTPGPGTYQSVEFDGSSCSKYGKSKFGKINSPHKRAQEIKETPGPCSYENLDGVLGTGHYKLARHIGNGGRVFGRQARFTGQAWHLSKNPGPSNYQVPTQFGGLQSINSVHN